MKKQETKAFNIEGEVREKAVLETFEDVIPKPATLWYKLWRAKQQIGAVSKNAKNPHFKNNYADINALTKEVEPILLEHGLLMMQPIVEGHVSTVIMDAESGESISSSMQLPAIQDPQKIGSAITYYRRYTLQSLLCLQTEDDDAQTASVAVKNTKPTINTERFEKALQAISEGKAKKEDLNQFELTEVQKGALSII